MDVLLGCEYFAKPLVGFAICVGGIVAINPFCLEPTVFDDMGYIKLFAVVQSQSIRKELANC